MINEPTHISHALLDIIDEWKLSSNHLTLSEDTRCEKICLIEDIFKIKKALLAYRYDKEFAENPAKLFDFLYDKTTDYLEIELCACFAEVKSYILQKGYIK